MESVEPNHSPNALQLDRINAWGIYDRLKQLSIPCQLSIGNPLCVQVDTPTTAIQVWSVIQRFTGSRQATLERLERCWQKRA